MARERTSDRKNACLEMVSADSILLFADGLDRAILGIAERDGHDFVVYDSEKIVQILRNRDGMSQDEAYEFFEINIAGAWLGEQTPIIVRPVRLT